ncbi:MAG: zinc-binding alcohol dehydrogenase family protein [Alphaproteobacteria bacterium]|nr:MAG: zinc-binding alcohol dehydrogenase family protein [Alphaproteobacteria bacterium]
MTEIPVTCVAVEWDPAAGRLREAERPVEAPTGHDLLVEVAAAAFNPVDLKMKGRIPADAPPRPLGYDAVGRVLAAGPQAEGFAPGERVWYAGAMQRAGSNARCQLVDARIVARAPEALSDADAAALPLTALTAWEAMFERLRLTPLSPQPRECRLLIINGAGGVGSIAIQLARLSGIHVTATAARPESRDWCRELGADEIVAHGTLGDLPENGFDVVFCCHDTNAYMPAMARLIAPQGLICSIVGATGPLDLTPLFQKSAGFLWEFMFTRPLFATADQARQGEILATIARLADEGRIRSTRTETLSGLSLATIAQGHERLASGRMRGKLVVEY